MKVAMAGLAALAALAGVCLAGSANAQMRASLQPASYGYVFADYDHFDAKGGSLDGGGLGAGWRFFRFFGAQLGGQFARKNGVDFYNGYVEGVGYLPLGPRLSLSASMGGAYAESSTSVTIGTTRFTASAHGSGYRAGVGLEYWVAPRWGIHAAFHRQNAIGVADDYGIGVAYRF